jgi:hypothetical protein
VSPGRRRRALLVVTLVGATWLAVWGAAAAAGWRVRPLPLLAALTLAASLRWLLAALAEAAPSLPRAEVRVAPSSPVGEDPRLLRHQRQLEDAAADPPSSGPILARIGELAEERLRLAHGNDASAGAGNGRSWQGAEPSGSVDAVQRLRALVSDRPPDRTQLSPRALTQLVDDLDSLAPAPRPRPGEDTPTR